MCDKILLSYALYSLYEKPRVKSILFSVNPGGYADEVKMDDVTSGSLIGPRQLARWLGVNVFVIYHWTGEKKIPHYRLGDGRRPRIRFDPGEIRKWLAEHRTAASDIAARFRRGTR